MSTKHPVFFSMAACLILVVSACGPAAIPMPRTTAELVTPTPEVFRPVDPSPASPGSTLPLTCQVTDLNVYVNKEWGYCFAYPMDFTLDQSRKSEGIARLYGPALEESPDPIHVSLEVTPNLVPEGSALPPLVDAYLSAFKHVTLPMPITREPWLVGSEPGEKVEPIPGLLSSRLILALHHNILFTLRFHPSDIDFAKQGLDDLTQTVSGSFAFLEGTVPPASSKKTISWSEFGRDISLSYDTVLAPWVEAQWVPEVPLTPEMMFAGAHPEYVEFRFAGYQGGMPYQLPLLVEDPVPQVMVFRTADFPGYGDDSPMGFASQHQALKNLLETGLDPARCGQPQPPEPALPYLPWINEKQSFCAQPKIIIFPGGKGLRYLTYYAQSPAPVLDQKVFYTFQGLTDDGQFYIAAFFPVGTGIFPREMPPCANCSQPGYDPIPEWQAVFEGQMPQLNAQQADKFQPSLTSLDELIQSIQIAD